MFKYVRDVLTDPGLAPQQHAAFIDATLHVAPRLLVLDAGAATQVCWLEGQTCAGQLLRHILLSS